MERQPQHPNHFVLDINLRIEVVVKNDAELQAEAARLAASLKGSAETLRDAVNAAPSAPTP